jgi:carboxymethylenebutenolidase
MSTNGQANGMQPAQSTSGFLSFNSLPPRLHITSEDDEFDEVTIQHWRDEGSAPV